jgi:hypothetical protein
VRQIISVDIKHYSFEEFIRFVFDRDVPPESEIPTSGERVRRWYYCTNAVFDLHRLSCHYVRLFTESARLLTMFSKPQLELGFSAMASACPFSMKKLIWNTDLAFAYRERVVRSMFYLFRDFFSIEPLRYMANIWWDGLCFEWEMGRRDRLNGGEDLAMQDVMFETMAKILSIDSMECRLSALHGLSHLHHPATPQLLRQYTSIFPSLERQCEEYLAEEAEWRERVKAWRSRKRT